jgi:hypothetical protein
MRNLTPINLLTTRLRGSQFEREILNAGIYPTQIHLQGDHAMLEWRFTDPSRRNIAASFFLILRGKSKGWAMMRKGQPTEPLEEHQFVSRLLSQYILGEDLLLSEAFVYDRVEFESLMELLYP